MDGPLRVCISLRCYVRGLIMDVESLTPGSLAYSSYLNMQNLLLGFYKLLSTSFSTGRLGNS